VDQYGHVCLCEQIGEVDLGGDLTLPLIIDFRSDREDVSPWLGRGWVLAPLDSSFFQTGDNAFLMTSPNGGTISFHRGENSALIEDGDDDWKAAIGDDNSITAWDDSGWKLSFVRGKLTGIETANRRHLELVYLAGHAVELREQGALKLSVLSDPATGQPTGLAFNNGQQLAFVRGQRPRVRFSEGKNSVAGTDDSLHHVGEAGSTFEFGVDDKTQPTVKVTNPRRADRLYQWDAKSRLIVTDGEHRYKIQPPKAAGQWASISRTNKTGQKESWYRDIAGGRETDLNLAGVTTIREWYTSGPLAGKDHQTTEIRKGVRTITNQVFYNEAGQRIREFDARGNSITYAYDASGRETETRQGETTLTRKAYDAQGLVTEELLDSGEKVTNTYQDDGTVERLIVATNGHKLFQTWKNGLKIRAHLAGQGEEHYGYDSHGTLNQITDAEGVVWDLKYGKQGAIIERYKNGLLHTKLFTDEAGITRIRMTYAPDGTPVEAWNWAHDQTYTTNIPETIAAQKWRPLE
jgi:YD repeat-containing protein